MTRVRSPGFSSVGRPRLVGALGLAGAAADHRRTTLAPQGPADADDDGEYVAVDAGDGGGAPATQRTALHDAPAPATAVPALYQDWREATLQSAARAAARRLVADDVAHALQVAAGRKGAPLTRDEAAQATAEVFKAKKNDVDALYVELLAASKKSRHLEDKAIRDAVRAAEPRIAKRPDPFGDAFAGGGGPAVLWRAPAWIVLVDVGADGAKALVAPRQHALFPVVAPERDPRPVVAIASLESGRRLVDDLALLSAHVADAMIAAFGGTPEAWINPPAGAAYGRLHAHVVVEGAPIDPFTGGQDECVQKAYAPVRERLAARLGPASS